jgi:hypothetical protein
LSQVRSIRGGAARRQCNTQAGRTENDRMKSGFYRKVLSLPRVDAKYASA